MIDSSKLSKATYIWNVQSKLKKIKKNINSKYTWALT